MVKAHILIINSKCPYPICDGAAIRSMQMIKMLSLMYAIDLVYIYDNKFGNCIKNPLFEICDSVRSFKISPFEKVFNLLLGLFQKRPLQCSYFYSSEAKKYVNMVIDSYAFVFCNNMRTAEYIIDSNCAKYIDYVDAISMNYKKAVKYSNWFWSKIYSFEYNRCVKYEDLILHLFSKKIIISDVDRDFVLGRNDNRSDIFVVGNAIEQDDELIEQNDFFNIVFLGKMSYEPNIVAVITFVKAIFPQILKKIPQSQFYIVGSHPTSKVKGLVSDNVHVTGYVDDVKYYLRKSTVVVAPMFTGAGVQNKILQAMSLGCAVVTTKTGAEGLFQIENGKDICIVDDDNILEFATLTSSIILDKEQRINIGKSAKSYVKRNYSFNAIYEDLKIAMK